MAAGPGPAYPPIMGKVHDTLDGRLREFVEAQRLYFVGTAPSGDAGHVNVSPKGHSDTFTVLDEHSVAYLDLTGSGAEGIAHIRDNGRVTVMFCAFEGPPDIVRLQGTGRVVLPGETEWEALLARFPYHPGARAVIVVELDRISSSCGFAVPLYDYVGDRTLLDDHFGRKSPEQIHEYHRSKNAVSIDGLPALEAQP
jgi:Pyridoxamine 5'-phosphate oxidase